MWNFQTWFSSRRDRWYDRRTGAIRLFTPWTWNRAAGSDTEAHRRVGQKGLEQVLREECAQVQDQADVRWAGVSDGRHLFGRAVGGGRGPHFGAVDSHRGLRWPRMWRGWSDRDLGHIWIQPGRQVILFCFCSFTQSRGPPFFSIPNVDSKTVDICKDLLIDSICSVWFTIQERQ